MIRAEVNGGTNSGAYDAAFVDRVLLIAEICVVLFAIGMLNWLGAAIGVVCWLVVQKDIGVRHWMHAVEPARIIAWLLIAAAVDAYVVFAAFMDSFRITLPAMIDTIYAKLEFAKFSLEIAGWCTVLRITLIATARIAARYEDRKYARGLQGSIKAISARAVYGFDTVGQVDRLRVRKF